MQTPSYTEFGGVRSEFCVYWGLFHNRTTEGGGGDFDTLLLHLKWTKFNVDWSCVPIGEGLAVFPWAARRTGGRKEGKGKDCVAEWWFPLISGVYRNSG